MGKKKKQERAHALLSASGATRWINCPPSARLEEKVPDTESEFAKAGTLAHSICELKLRKLFTEPGMTSRTYNTRMNKLKKDPLYKEEMQGYTDQYVDHVSEVAYSFPVTPFVSVERRVEYGDYAPEGFGTADCIILYGTEMHVIDFKYGKGVPVSAEGNYQLGLYALGALQAYGFLFPIEKVVLHVVQPRLNNFSVWETTKKDLESWGNVVVKPAADLAFAGEGEFRSGEHCKFCRVLNCRKRAFDNLELESYGGKLPPELSDEEVGEALRKGENLVAWHKKLKAYAQNALIDGKPIPGWKLVQGRSNRVFKDFDGAVDALVKSGYEKELFYQTVALPLTQIEEAVGKKELRETCGEFIIKPPGAPTIAKEEDKRPIYSPRSTAAQDFKEVKNGEV